MKVSRVINRALRIIKVLDAGESATGEDAAGAIEALNAMLTRWEANGLSMGWTNVSLPSDDLPVPDEAEEAIAYNLALRIAPEYGIVPGRDVQSMADRFLMDVRRDRMVTNPLRQVADSPLPSIRGSYRIC